MIPKRAAAAAAVLIFSSCAAAEQTPPQTAAPAAETFSFVVLEQETSVPKKTLTQTETETEIEIETEAVTEDEFPGDERQPEESGTAVVAFAGDVTQSDVFGDITEALGISYSFRDVAEIFSSADIAFVNLETSVSERGVSEKKPGYAFRSDPDKLEVLTDAGIDIVSAANNHVRDFGMDALCDTFENLEKHGLEYVGAGRDIEAASKLAVFSVNGLKIGFTACTSFIQNDDWFAGEDKAGINCVYMGEESERAFLEKVRRYSGECDVLFVSVHWGIEYLHAATQEQRDFAHRLCDSGADIILGHHPHVLEPIEYYDGKMIFYSLGNFLFYKMDDDAGKTALFTVEIDRNGFIGGRMYPVFIEDRRSYLLGQGGDMYNEIIALENEMSAGCGVQISGDGNIICERQS